MKTLTAISARCLAIALISCEISAMPADSLIVDDLAIMIAPIIIVTTPAPLSTSQLPATKLPATNHIAFNEDRYKKHYENLHQAEVQQTQAALTAKIVPASSAIAVAPDIALAPDLVLASTLVPTPTLVPAPNLVPAPTAAIISTTTLIKTSKINSANHQSTINPPSAAPLLVIILDDIGNNLERGMRAVELPGAITYGILPHTPLAQKLAFYATQLNPDKEIIIHMPMEANSHKRLGPGGLELQQPRESFVATLQSAMHDIPFAKGMSNHMGSKLTATSDRMRWLMVELEKSDFYFIDSKTTRHSVALAEANQQRVPYLARDIFLDHDPHPKAIDRAYKKALKLAERTGLAIIIAHPYPTTLNYLEQKLPELEQTAIQLVNASEAMHRQHKRPRQVTLSEQKITRNQQLAL